MGRNFRGGLQSTDLFYLEGQFRGQKVKDQGHNAA